MNQTVENTTQDTATETTIKVETVPRGPSNKSRADAIFAVALANRAAGQFKSNRDFRASILAQLQSDLGVSVASAATLYNSAKKDAEAADPALALGRDPKKEKPVSTGRRGRPAGSKNKAKVAEHTVVIAVPSEEPAAEKPAEEAAMPA